MERQSAKAVGNGKAHRQRAKAKCKGGKVAYRDHFKNAWCPNAQLKCKIKQIGTNFSLFFNLYASSLNTSWRAKMQFDSANFKLQNS